MGNFFQKGIGNLVADQQNLQTSPVLLPKYVHWKKSPTNKAYKLVWDFLLSKHETLWIQIQYQLAY